MKVEKLTNFLDKNFPFDLASSFDQGKMGLQVGSKNSEITAILITLDITRAVIDEALQKKANVIISHHPFIFNPLIRIDYDELMGEKLLKTISNNLNVINIHTNYDSAFGGMNDELAKIIGLSNVSSYHEELVDNNFLRYGNCQKSTLRDLAELVKDKFNLKAVRVIGDLNKGIRTVGIVGGSGASEIEHALEVGCDVLITGEVKHNYALMAKERGLAVIEVSHHIESSFKKPLKEILRKEFKNVDIYLSKEDVDSFVII